MNWRTLLLLISFIFCGCWRLTSHGEIISFPENDYLTRKISTGTAKYRVYVPNIQKLDQKLPVTQ